MTVQYLFIIVLLILCLRLFSFKNLFLLRNVFIVYTFSVYNIAPLVLSTDSVDSYSWSFEFLVVLLLFVVGYIGGLRWARSHKRVAISHSANNRGKERTLVVVLSALLLGNALFLVYKVISFGVADYYAGAQLAATVQNYGKADPTGAFHQVVTFILSAATIACLAVFVERVASQQGALTTTLDYSKKRRLALRLGFAWLVLFPILQFSRSALVYGGATYLAMRSRLRSRPFRLGLVVLAGLALVFFVYVGLSRSYALGGSDKIESLFVSELTPWMAYRDIKVNIDQLGYQYGGTILAPFLLKLVPRGVYPEKPYNTSGYFMTALYPDLFKAGFALPPTLMGDLYLNFGSIGLLLGILVFGTFTGRFDGIVVYRQTRYMGLYFLVFTGYVSLLRDNLADALFVLTTYVLLYFLVSKWAQVRFKLRQRSQMRVGRYSDPVVQRQLP